MSAGNNQNSLDSRPNGRGVGVNKQIMERNSRSLVTSSKLPCLHSEKRRIRTSEESIHREVIQYTHKKGIRRHKAYILSPLRSRQPFYTDLQREEYIHDEGIHRNYADIKSIQTHKI